MFPPTVLTAMSPLIMAMPWTISFSGPVLDATSVQYATPSQLNWSWSSVPGSVQYVRAHVQAIDTTGSSVIEEISCTVPAADREVRVPSSWWTQTANTGYWVVFLTTVRENHSTISNGGEAVIFGEYTIVGALYPS